MTQASATTRTTRKDDSRDLSWEPPQQLDTPTAPDGMQYRWVRWTIRNDEDFQNVLKRQRQHYEPVRIEEIPEHERPQYQSIEGGRHAGIITMGDLILMKVPEQVARQREQYYRRKTRDQQQRVDQELDKQQNEKMPISRETRSRVSYGRGSASFED